MDNAAFTDFYTRIVILYKKRRFTIENSFLIDLPNIQLMKLHISHRLLKETRMKQRTKEPAEVVISDGSHEAFGVEVDITSMQKIPFFREEI